MFSRRSFMQSLSISTFFVTAGGVTACALPRASMIVTPEVFPEGVASGDPTEERVVLWTRMLPLAEEVRTSGVLEVSRSADFTSVMAQEEVHSLPESDWTLRVVLGGLDPDTIYFYRFVRLDGSSSVVGRTATAPRADVDRNVRFAFASCQNRQTGWYHAYRHLLQQDAEGGSDSGVEFVLFLGDFIYEEIFQGVQRDLKFPGAEDRPPHAISLDDYRFLYKSYLSDPYLQRARARWPFMSIWDDHEFSNNSWQAVSTYTLKNEPAQSRKVAANQAWFEFIPAQLSSLKGEQLARDFEHVSVSNAPLTDAGGMADNLRAIESLRIPRRLAWGKRVDLLLTDSRSFRSRHPVPPSRALELSFHPHAFLPVDEVKDWDSGAKRLDETAPEIVGTMWGAEQKEWLKRSLKESDAVWKICGVSIPMSELTVDFGLAGKQLSAVETALNVDSFDGYPSERAELLTFLKDEGIGNVISLTGDNHMHFASVLGEGHEMGAAAVEFAVAGISSTNYFRVFDLHVRRVFPEGPVPQLFSVPGKEGESVAWLNASILYGYEQVLSWQEEDGAPSAERLAQASRRLPALRYLDTDSYGIALATAGPDVFSVEYLVFSHEDITGEYPATPLPPARRTQLHVRGGETANVSKPQFGGGAPFPFNS